MVDRWKLVMLQAETTRYVYTHKIVTGHHNISSLLQEYYLI